AFPPTQIAPTGYISYTIHPEDVVSQSEILANPYYVEKIHSVYWTRPFYQTERQRQRVTDECVFQESLWRILVRNDPVWASTTDPDRRRLEVLRVAAMNPALAEMKRFPTRDFGGRSWWSGWRGFRRTTLTPSDTGWTGAWREQRWIRALWGQLSASPPPNGQRQARKRRNFPSGD
ncbi:MAG: hypothetical protein H5T64_07330, partial [Chloroflexi bacterium]|nr:hypothetical protein [Chloroflexota bacterium]